MPTAAVLRALLVLVLLLAPLVPGRAFAQDPAPECDTGDCAPRGAGQGNTSSDELARSAARIRQARTDFVPSLRHLLEALSGTYGDEGPALRAATAGMAEALRRWDRAIRAYQTPLEKVTGQADEEFTPPAGSRRIAPRCSWGARAIATGSRRAYGRRLAPGCSCGR